VAIVGATSTLAQDLSWPTKPVHLVVPGPAGGVADARARWLAERLAPGLGQAVIVDNKAGAGGNIGTAFVAHAVGDGYTLLLVHQGTLAINPYIYSHVGYEPLVDFAPVAPLGIGPLLLAVNADLPVKSVSELVQLAKAKPGFLSYGSPGYGSPPNLAAELFKAMAGIESTHVPYKGGGQVATDLIAGHIQWTIDGFTVLMPHVTSGRLRALAVTSAQRLPAWPDLPTVSESGLPGYEYVGWLGIAAPAGTPKQVIARLHREMDKVTGTPEALEFFATTGSAPGKMTSDEFGAFIRTEYAKWGKVVRDAGIRAE
jgi:tripartite-type tricarboxylate transporter receptor subunit TctC